MEKLKLLHAEKITMQLLTSVEKNGLIKIGMTEDELNNEVSKLAREQFDIKDYWHKKIVRFGRNTTAIYNDNPPNLILKENDILFIDYGPVVNGYEADCAMTFVVGDDDNMIKLKNDVVTAWYETKEWYDSQNGIKASNLYNFVVLKAMSYGWKYGGEIAGHIVGKYPHEQPDDPKSLELDIHPSNHNDMSLMDSNGNKRNWILEMHFIDEKNQIGAYFEKLL